MTLIVISKRTYCLGLTRINNQDVITCFAQKLIKNELSRMQSKTFTL